MTYNSFCPFTQDGSTALIYAAENGHRNLVSLLVEAHADINLPDKAIILLSYNSTMT